MCQVSTGHKIKDTKSKYQGSGCYISSFIFQFPPFFFCPGHNLQLFRCGVLLGQVGLASKDIWHFASEPTVLPSGPNLASSIPLSELEVHILQVEVENTDADPYYC